MSQPIPQTNFTIGEISPRFTGRIDSDQYGAAVAKAVNVDILPQGPVRKRSGTFYIRPTKYQLASAKSTVAWIDFVFSSTQSYAIEAGDKYFRFHAVGGTVFLYGVPYEVVTPYLHTHVNQLKFKQINDVLYITHTAYAPRKLSRISETNWTLVIVDYLDGPYLDLNKTDTWISWNGTFKPGGVGLPVGTWDNSIVAGGTSVAVNSNFDYTCNGVNEFAVDGYAIFFKGYVISGTYGQSVSEQPRSWNFLGKAAGSSAWVILDTRQDESDWIPGETRLFEFSNTTGVKYNAFRLSVLSNNGFTTTRVDQITLKMQGTVGTFTFNTGVGINKNAGFGVGDIGRPIRFQGPDGYWRFVNITGVVNNRTVTGEYHGLWMIGGPGNTNNWKLGAFSTATGFPAAITLFEERIALGGSLLQPRTVWLTRTGDFESFRETDPITDANPITITLTGERADAILWLDAGKGIFVGNSGGVASISGGNEPLTYKNIQQIPQTNYGTSNNAPIRVGPALLYQAAFLDCMRELLFNFNDDSYDAPNITLMNEHLYKNMGPSAWLPTPDDRVITVAISGTIASMTYERAQKIHGSTVHTTDGLFTHICAIPNGSKRKNDLYYIVKRTINGVQQQYVEIAADPFENQNINTACFMDSSLSYVGVAASTFSGLSHLEGKAVKVTGFVANETSPKIYDRTVVGGSITVPVPLTKAMVGLFYSAYIETLPSRAPRVDGATRKGSRQRVDNVTLDVYKSAGLTVRAFNSSSSEQAVFREATAAMDQSQPLVSGLLRTNLDGTWSGLGVIEVKSVAPLPMLIKMIMPESEVEL